MNRAWRTLLTLIASTGLLAAGAATCDGLRGVSCAGDDPGCDASLYLVQFLAAFRINYYPTHLYVTDSSTTGRAYAVDRSTGRLTAGGTFGAGNNPGEMAVHPGADLLYVSGRNTLPGIYGYSLQSDPAAPAALNGSPFIAGTSFGKVAIDPVAGNLLYAANSGGVSVYGYHIDPTTGGLSTVSGAPFGASCVMAVTLNQSGTYLYVSNFISSAVRRFPVDRSTGSLGAFTDQTFLALRSISISSDDRFFYGTDNATGLNNYMIANINAADGSLSPISGSPFALGAVSQLATDLAVDSRQRWAYVLNATAAQVHIFSVDSVTGAFTETASSPIATQASPSQVAVAPGDGFVYVGGGTAIQVYQIEKDTGALTEVESISGVSGVVDMVFRQASEPSF